MNMAASYYCYEGKPELFQKMPSRKTLVTQTSMYVLLPLGLMPKSDLTLDTSVASLSFEKSDRVGFNSTTWDL